MLLSIIEYGNIFLMSASDANKKRLQKRCALQAEYITSTNDLHVEAQLLKLKVRREQHILNFMYVMSKIPTNVRNRGTIGVRTRSSKKKLLKIRTPRTERFGRSLAHYGPKKWNRLPVGIQLTVLAICNQEPVLRE